METILSPKDARQALVDERFNLKIDLQNARRNAPLDGGRDELVETLSARLKALNEKLGLL